jgi:hypothetical protein
MKDNPNKLVDLNYQIIIRSNHDHLLRINNPQGHYLTNNVQGHKLKVLRLNKKHNPIIQTSTIYKRHPHNHHNND